MNRRGIAIDVLPPEVPIRNVDQPLTPALRELRVSLDRAGEVVRVWLDGEQFHIHRQHVPI
jgi:hypothetical protein